MTPPSDISGPRPLRVAIVDDHEIVVQGLAMLLTSAQPAAELVPDARLHEADVVLFDPHGHAGGWDVLDDLLTTGIPVVVFSWEPPSAPYFAAVDAVGDGLVGFLPKSSSAEAVARALHAVAAGRTLHPQRRTTSEGPAGAWPGQVHGLSARESDVVLLILRGLGNADIAAALFLSVNTVKTHIRSSYRKMDVATRAGAIMWGVSHGMLPADG